MLPYNSPIRLISAISPTANNTVIFQYISQMELKLHIGYQDLLDLVRQLPNYPNK